MKRSDINFMYEINQFWVVVILLQMQLITLFYTTIRYKLY